MKFQVLFVCAVVCLEFFIWVDALKVNDTGVCVVTSSVRKTRRKTYLVRTKNMCGKKRCVVKRTKTEVYKTSKNQTVCCAGWLYASDTDSCAPQCSTGCIGGRCIKPETCQCDPPAILDETTKNICISPTCDPPCQNGVCIGENNCSCLQDFEKINGICEPKCTKGYRRDVQGACQPECRGCDFGVCSTPNNCTCNEGYRWNSTSEVCCPNDCESCDPLGNCLDGICGDGTVIASCCKGWTFSAFEDSCKPKCINCGDGYCDSPNVCSCPQSFKNVRGRCKKICKPGYKFINATVCEPICKDLCINGDCDAPDTCKCKPGYVRVNATLCEPKCNNCLNGHCFGPNDCRCYEGYIMEDDVCKPICTNKCINGKCIGPDTCKCDLGFTADSSDKFKCIPVCKPTCVNALCKAPNICSCFAGYEAINKTTCKPKCDNCINGECVGPNDCRCYEGYSMVKAVCEPICSNPCTNGKCVAPDTCKCDLGFTADSSDKFKCIPVCKPTCVNALCKAPNICSCFAGYEAINKTTCKPKCNHCVNGICDIDGSCKCNPGFNYVNNTCITSISVNCTNCTSNDDLCLEARSCPLKESSFEVVSPTGLAGLEMSWLIAGCVGLTLITLLIGVIGHMWRKRKQYDTKNIENGLYAFGSVVYTIPNTLQNRKHSDARASDDLSDIEDDENDDNEEKLTKEQLLPDDIVFQHERL